MERRSRKRMDNKSIFWIITAAAMRLCFYCIVATTSLNLFLVTMVSMSRNTIALSSGSNSLMSLSCSIGVLSSNFFFCRYFAFKVYQFIKYYSKMLCPLRSGVFNEKKNGFECYPPALRSVQKNKKMIECYPEFRLRIKPEGFVTLIKTESGCFRVQ